MTTDELEVVILCGGRGTRAYPVTREIPKPLIEIGGRPIVEHVMAIHAAQGITRFVLATGWLGDQIAERYVAPPDGWNVRVVDTGLDTATGERVQRVAAGLTGETFLVTYADGLADIDVRELLATHRRADALATVTTVPLPSPYGTVTTDHTGRILTFREKPRLPEHRINGGFMAFDRNVFDHWSGTDLEVEVLPRMAELGFLYAHRHEGFWRSMDTVKDRLVLEELALEQPEPWMP